MFIELGFLSQLISMPSSLALAVNKSQVESVFNQRVIQNFIVSFAELIFNFTVS